MKRYKTDESFVRTKMVEDPQGEWVKYEDVVGEIVELCDSIIELMEDLRSELNKVKEGAGCFCS